MAVRISTAVQQLQGSVVYAESCPSSIGPITLEVKQTGERSAGNPHAAFDVAGAGNVARSRWCDTRSPKGRDNREHKLRPKPARQSSTLPGRGACDETHVPTATSPRVHHAARRHDGGMAARGARAT